MSHKNRPAFKRAVARENKPCAICGEVRDDTRPVIRRPDGKIIDLCVDCDANLE